MHDIMHLFTENIQNLAEFRILGYLLTHVSNSRVDIVQDIDVDGKAIIQFIWDTIKTEHNFYQKKKSLRMKLYKLTSINRGIKTFYPLHKNMLTHMDNFIKKILLL